MNQIVHKVFEGEILTDDDDLFVFIAEGPLRQSTIKLRMPAGKTLYEIMREAMGATAARFQVKDYVVHLNHDEHIWPIPQENWHRVRPKPRTKIVMRPRASGPLAGIFAAIGSAFAAVKGVIAGLGIFGKILMSVVGMGIKWLINQLFAPKPVERPKLADPIYRYSVTGSRNQTNQYGAVPVVLGTHRITPPYGALPYSEISGDEQYLRMLFVNGYGAMEIDSETIKIGETKLGSFQDVNWSVREGYGSDPSTSVYPLAVVEEALSIVLDDPANMAVRTTGADVTEVHIDLTWPQGLTKLDDQGNRGDWTSDIQWRYRPMGGSEASWNVIENYKITGGTQDTLRRTLKTTLPSGQWDIGVRNLSYPVADTRVIEDVQWTALRGFRTGEPITFDDPLSVTAVIIRGTSQLNGTVDTLNAIAKSVVVRSWDGTNWVPGGTSNNPANLFRHVLQMPANKRPMPDAKIDLVALQNWHAYCVANKYTYNRVITSQMSVFELLHEIAAAGRAMPVWKDGKWSVTWDDPDAPIVQVFTPRNSWNFQEHREYNPYPHAFRVRFVNEKKGYIEDERVVYDDGYNASNATIFEGIEFPGVTDPDIIWRHARYHIAQRRLRPSTYELFVDFEGLVLTRNDRVRVQHDVMLVGISAGRVITTTAIGPGVPQTVIVDEPLLVDPSYSYQFRFRRDDGTFLVRDVEAGVSGFVSTFPLVGDTSLPADGTLYTFGISGSDSGIYRVASIEPMEDHVHKLTLVDDAPEIATADTGTIPDFDAGVTAPFDPYEFPPYQVVVTGGVHEINGQFYEYLNTSWVLARVANVQRVEVEYYSQQQGRWIPAGSVNAQTNNFKILYLNSGTYITRVRSIFNDNSFSKWTQSASFNADNLTNPPDDVVNFSISTLGETSTLSWDPVINANASYQIRFAPASVGLPIWNTASPLALNIGTTTLQVPTMIGTYFIKAVLPSGVQSTNATSIQTAIGSLSGLNVVETITEDPDYLGTKDAVEVTDGEIRLASFNTIDKWEALSDISALSVGDGDTDSVGMEPYGIYYFNESIDLMSVYTSRLSAAIDAYGYSLEELIVDWASLDNVAAIGDVDPTYWSATLQYAATDSDPVLNDWSAWQDLIVGDVTARALKFRVVLKGKEILDGAYTYSVVSPAIRHLSVQIDMPDRVEGEEDIVISAAGQTITFPNGPFAIVPAIAIAAQGLATGDYYEISAKTEATFFVRFRNTAGTGISRTMDYVAKGYGRES